MRLTPVVAIVSFLVLLLTWLSLRAINPEAELFDQALAEIDHFATMENALYRDVFTARAGTLRNYDPLVHEIVALRNSLDRLRRDRRDRRRDGGGGRSTRSLRRPAGRAGRAVQE